MGHTDLFVKANDLLADELHFRVNSDELRVWVVMAGWERTEHCIKLVKLWARPRTTKKELYDRLMRLLQLVTPSKAPGTKRRNPLSEHGFQQSKEIDREMMAAIDRDE